MRGFRLNGWQRIGIILSVLWLVVGGLLGWKVAVAPYVNCMEKAPTPDAIDFCVKHTSWVFDTAWFSALFVALVPLPIAWLLVYTVVWTVRWVRRGFQPAR